MAKKRVKIRSTKPAISKPSPKPSARKPVAKPSPPTATPAPNIAKTPVMSKTPPLMQVRQAIREKKMQLDTIGFRVTDMRSKSETLNRRLSAIENKRREGETELQKLAAEYKEVMLQTEMVNNAMVALRADIADEDQVNEDLAKAVR